MGIKTSWFAATLVSFAMVAPVHAQTSVCVDIEIRSWAEDADGVDTDLTLPEGGLDIVVEGQGAATGHGAGEGAAPTGEGPRLVAAELDAEADVDADVDADVPAVDAEIDALEAELDAERAQDEGSTDEADVGYLDLSEDVEPSAEALADGEASASASATVQIRRVPPAAPRGLDARGYLRRLLEHQITHRPGFEAVREHCDERITLQLYPLAVGWTVFGRYTGHAREEKVDMVQLDEFQALAARLAAALLRDVSIQETMTRLTVLREDSERRLRTVEGGRQFMFSVGTALTLGQLPTAPSETAPAQDELRLSAPLAFGLGFRNRFRAWALDAAIGGEVGTQRRAESRNVGGGHADFAFAVTAGLHFLRYRSPAAINSFYYGGGASFRTSHYRIIGPASGGTQPDTQGAWGGGMNVDFVVGYELMRASALHFFVELDANVPVYVLEGENDHGRISGYSPTAVAKIGILR